MKNTVIILFFFIAGVLFGIYEFVPEAFSGDNMTTYVLYALLFLVGVGVVGHVGQLWYWIFFPGKNLKVELKI